MVELERFLVAPGDSIRTVMARIDKNAKQIALVVDDARRLLGTLTDGDLRRAILAGIQLEAPATALLERRAGERPLTAPVATPVPELLRLMTQCSVRHIPLVDGQGRVVDVAILSDIIGEYREPLHAVVMAGGYGKRLRPLTDELPKPMLPMGDRPLLEHIIDRLQEAGIKRVNLSTHYKADLITSHFQDGHDFGVEIEYLKENEPLGTAGALGLLSSEPGPLVVMNGDILTRIDFRAMLDFHREQKAALTVAVRCYEHRLPYGVVETSGVEIRKVDEKPAYRHFVNAGIYLVDPDVCRYVPRGQRCDMPELIDLLVKDGRRVVAFPMREYWLDIGRVEDYRQGIADLLSGAA